MKDNPGKKTRQLENNGIFYCFHSGSSSLLSSSSGFNNFRGLLNLGLILLCVYIIEFIYDNVKDHGRIIDANFWIFKLILYEKKSEFFSILLASNLFIIPCLILEKFHSRMSASSNFFESLTIINLTCSLLAPGYFIITFDLKPIIGVFFMFFYMIVFLKLWSYTSVNRSHRNKIPDEIQHPKEIHKMDFQNFDYLELRSRSRSLQSQKKLKLSSKRKSYVESFDSDECCYDFSNPVPVVRSSIKYPENLTIKNIYYFMFIPTLCYEINFPMIINRRKCFILSRICEIIVLLQIKMSLIEKFIIPELLMLFKQRRQHSINQIELYEKLYRLALPCQVIFLIGFYTFFHSTLNLVGEIFKFGDRMFYKDWWNSETIFHYWSSWNLPVHQFAKRHIFIPLRRRGYGQNQAAFAVFFISAVMHEYLASFPLKLYKFWSFFGMLSPIPLSYLMKKLPVTDQKLGNIIIWTWITISQPIVLLYINDYMLENENQFLKYIR